MTATSKRYNVGGVMLDRPFKIRRLGHFGFNAHNMEECLHFYRDLLGFKLSDVLDFKQIPGMGEKLEHVDDGRDTSSTTATITTPSSCFPGR